MLIEEDIKKLKQLTKEAKELPNFNIGMLFELFFKDNPSILFDICRRDDGQSNFQESELMNWYFNYFIHQVKSDVDSANEALDFVVSNL